MSTTLKIRFVGRFMFVPENPTSQGKRCDRMHVFGIDMQFNPHLAADPHRLLLSVRHENVAPPFPEPFATIVTAEPDETAVREYLMWDLAGCSTSVEAGARSGVAVSFPETHRLGGRIHSAALYPTPAGVPVAFRFSIDAGDFREIVFDQHVAQAREKGGRKPAEREGDRPRYDLVPLGSGLARSAHVTLPDGVVATFETDAAAIELRQFKGSTRMIRLMEKGKGPIICSITNTCGEHEQEGVKDGEYAAFYDMLAKPPSIPDRIVPRRISGVESVRGASGGRCYKQAVGSL